MGRGDWVGWEGTGKGRKGGGTDGEGGMGWEGRATTGSSYP